METPRMMLQPGESLREIERILKHTDFGAPGLDAPCACCKKPLFALGKDADEPTEWLGLGYMHKTCIAEMEQRLFECGYVSLQESDRRYQAGRKEGWDRAKECLNLFAETSPEVAGVEVLTTAAANS